MMNINGIYQIRTLGDPCLNQKVSDVENLSVQQLLLLLNIQGNYFAVACNNEFVPRSTYGQQQLNEGDKIEIVSPMQGG